MVVVVVVHAAAWMDIAVAVAVAVGTGVGVGVGVGVGAADLLLLPRRCPTWPPSRAAYVETSLERRSRRAAAAPAADIGVGVGVVGAEYETTVRAGLMVVVMA